MLNSIMTPNLVLGDIKSMKRGKIGIFWQNTVAFVQGSDYYKGLCTCINLNNYQMLCIFGVGGMYR